VVPQNIVPELILFLSLVTQPNIRIYMKPVLPALNRLVIIQFLIWKGILSGVLISFFLFPTVPLTVPYFNDLKTKVFITVGFGKEMPLPTFDVPHKSLGLG